MAHDTVENNPGSFSDFAADSGLDPTISQTREEYGRALDTYRSDLAESLGITPEALHDMGAGAVQGVQQEA